VKSFSGAGAQFALVRQDTRTPRFAEPAGSFFTFLGGCACKKNEKENARSLLKRKEKLVAAGGSRRLTRGRGLEQL